MSNYENLRGECYKRLYPDGIPLEMGCELVMHGKHRTVLCWNMREEAYLLNDYRLYTDTELKFLRDVQILGKPLQIADVLRAFEKIGYHAQIECDGQFYAYEDITEFNLSLPLSHPSQDEACGKVLSLLTNNKDNET